MPVFSKIYSRSVALACIAIALLTACDIDGTQHIISYGQSLSTGERAVLKFPENLNLPTDYEVVGLMFSDGVRSLGVLPMVPFLENNAPASQETLYTPTGGETPLYGVLKHLKDLPGVRIGSAAGRGGTNIEGLSRGSKPYERLLTQVRNAKSQAKPPYTVPAIIWLQGESDDSLHIPYAELLNKLADDLDKDIRAITGQFNPVQIHICVTATAIPAAAQRVVAAQNSNVHIACVNADYEKSDRLHFSAAGSRAAGMALGASMLKEIKTK